MAERVVGVVGQPVASDTHVMVLRLSVAVLFAAALPAQLITVDPNGGGTYTDLQTAINAAPPGAVIYVTGGSFGPLTITRSVTIVGRNLPNVKAPQNGLGVQPAAITITGTGTERVVLAGLDVRGFADGFTWNVAGPGIRASGIAQLALHDCQVLAHQWINTTGSAPSASGVVVVGPVAVQILRTMVLASRSWPVGDNWWAPDGAPGVDAPAATVTVLGSTIQGGWPQASRFTMSLPGPTACPCLPGSTFPGLGGTGLVAAVLHESVSSIQGGPGSAVEIGPPLAPSWTPWGQQPTGPALVVGTQFAWAPTLQQLTMLRPGQAHQVVFQPTTTLSLFAMGTPLPAPATVAGIPFVALDVTLPYVLDALLPGATGHTLVVPNSPLLYGFQLAEQRFDLLPSGQLVASNPLLNVVQP